jgi:hypothetical protein
VTRILPPLAAILLLAAACGGASTAGPAPPAPPADPAPAAPAEPPATTAEDDELQVSSRDWKTDFSKHTVPLGEIESGGPPKDGIPAIDEPVFESVQEAADWIEPREPVVELEIAGEARAYPLQILIWHEIANDEVGGTPVSVTFCPLCNTALAFDRRLDGLLLDFGTTGNLRNSDLVMYDRQTETWWQQFGGEGIVGELAGKRLVQVPSRIVAFEDFAARHADGKVLSRETGYSRQYGQNPYAGYDNVDSPPFFPADNLDDDRLRPKERVVFLEQEGEAVVIPFAALEAAGTIELEVGGEPLVASWIPGVASALDGASIAGGRNVGSAEVRSAGTGELVAFDTPFWFSVAAFRPDVRIVTGP